MNAVMLRRDCPNGFRRAVRDENGKVLRVLTFEPGIPVELDAEDYAAVKEDIGKALIYPRISTPPPKPQEQRSEAEDAPSFGRKRLQRK